MGSAEFGVTTVNVATLQFGSGGAAPAHDLSALDANADHLTDVNGDGFLDLVVHFKTEASGLTSDDTQACMYGQTTAGVELEGYDSIDPVGAGKAKGKNK